MKGMYHKKMCLIIIFLKFATCLSNEASVYPKNTMSRLPRNVKPNFYKLQLLTRLKASDNFTYSGEVHIDISVLSPTNSITLHADDLKILENKTTLSASNHSVAILSQHFEDKKQFYVISFLNDIKVGNYILSLFFTGEIRDDVFGFYRSSSKVGNETKWIGVTQFSSTFARRAFPCFDEPYLKSRFKLHIGHYSDQKVLSNTIVESTDKTNTEDYVITTMKSTPKISTYLIGWVIHDFVCSDLQNSSSFRICTRSTMAAKGFQSLEQGKLIYDTLESWIGIKDLMPKIDHVAIPDFHFSAMENFAMITARESVLLHESNVTPTRTVHSGRTTMAHEYAHTYFGNLVTPEFWNVAWLKEGFATYFSYLIRSLVQEKVNDFKFMDLFVVETLQDVLLDDSVKHKRTMNGLIPGEVASASECLDFVTYKKGASVIRMTEQLMSAKNFQTAMRSYLKDQSYNFTTPAVLYQYLNNCTSELPTSVNIGEVIETFATQPGFPLVMITRNYSSNSIQISQQRFYQNTGSIVDRFNNSRWWIPLNFATNSTIVSNMTRFGSLLMKRENKKINVSIDVNPSQWIICDIDKAGYYRVNYDDKNWNILIGHLRSRSFRDIHQIARATLIDDSMNLARAGYLSYKIPLDLSNYLARETKYEPWIAAINSFKFLHRMFKNIPIIRTKLENHVNRVTEVIYHQFLTFDESKDEQLRTKLLRNLILSTACLMKNSDCLKTTKSLFRNWMNDSKDIVSPNVKSFVYCEGIRDGTAHDWEEVFRRFNNTELHTEKELLISSLGCTRNKTIINKFLNYSIFVGRKLPKQYQINIFNAILTGNSKNVENVLEFMDVNFNNMIQMRGHTFLKKIINSVKTEIVSETERNKLIKLVENHKDFFGESLKTANNAIQFARETISWIEKYSPIIAEYFNQ